MQETIVCIRLGEIQGVLLRLGRTCHAAGRPVAALNWQTVDAAVDPTTRRSSIGTPKSSLQSVIFMGIGMSTSTGDIVDVYRDLTRLTSIASLVFFNQSWCVVLLPSCRITNQDEGFFLPGHELTVISRSGSGDWPLRNRDRGRHPCSRPHSCAEVGMDTGTCHEKCTLGAPLDLPILKMC